MTKLKLGPIPDDKPIKLTVDLPANLHLHLDLVVYGEVLGRSTGQEPVKAERVIAPILERFMATDRGLRKRDGSVPRRPTTNDIDAN